MRCNGGIAPHRQIFGRALLSNGDSIRSSLLNYKVSSMGRIRIGVLRCVSRPPLHVRGILNRQKWVRHIAPDESRTRARKINGRPHSKPLVKLLRNLTSVIKDRHISGLKIHLASRAYPHFAEIGNCVYRLRRANNWGSGRDVSRSELWSELVFEGRRAMYFVNPRKTYCA